LTTKNWGYHYRFNGIGNIDLVKSKENIENFARELVKEIKMIPYGEPWVVHFGDTEEVAGHTLTQLIMTSNISGHFVDKTGEIFIDVFSCKDFDAGFALMCIKKFFGVENEYSHDFIARSAKRFDFGVSVWDGYEEEGF
jgi:S-adenosylmethionine/arginine decarboxylase-like enzyme